MKRRVIFLLIAVLALAAFALQRFAVRRATAGAYGAGALEGDVLVSLLGGFRGIAAEIVWFRAERLQDNGQFVELAQLATLLTRMEPHTPEVWSYAAWNLAYNISVQMPSFEDRWRWVEAGLKLLRDDGLAINPTDASLHREIAWMFLAKIGGDIDDAHAVYARIWRERMSAARESGDYSALRMDPEAMRSVEREYGVKDWGDPSASALYWAVRGLPHAAGVTRQALRRIIYQALILMSERDSAHAPRAYAEIQSFAREYPSPQVEQLLQAFREGHALH